MLKTLLIIIMVTFFCAQVSAYDVNSFISEAIILETSDLHWVDLHAAEIDFNLLAGKTYRFSASSGKSSSMTSDLVMQVLALVDGEWEMWGEVIEGGRSNLLNPTVNISPSSVERFKVIVWERQCPDLNSCVPSSLAETTVQLDVEVFDSN